jgi:hypothetical protein
MDEKVRNINRLAIGDIIHNGQGHYIVLEGLPYRRDSGWLCAVTHVRGEYRGNQVYGYLLTKNENGDTEHLKFHEKSSNRTTRGIPSMGDSKIKHYFR